MTKQRKASVRRGPSMSQTYPVTCGAAVHSTHGRLGGKLSCASGTYGTQEAGTRTPQVRHGCGTLWLHVYTAGDNAADDVGGDLVRARARARVRVRGRVRVSLTCARVRSAATSRLASSRICDSSLRTYSHIG